MLHGVLDTILCDQGRRQLQAVGQWFSPGTDTHNMNTKILIMKMVLHISDRNPNLYPDPYNIPYRYQSLVLNLFGNDTLNM